MREYIDGSSFKDMILHAAAALETHKQSINELNVFPVPDGDTGTNMSLTMGAAAAELRKTTPQSVGKATEITASALLRGARGNSGVILSLLFRGIAKKLRDKELAGGLEFAEAMAEGVTAAYKAVMKPAEGTILTVSRLASECARQEAADGAGAEETLISAIEAGNEALADTINKNPVLKKAGVIDAGGKGYIIILEAMLAAMRGEALPEVEVSAAKDKADFSEFESGDITFGYCTEFIVSRENRKEPMLLNSFLSALGDSIVVVDDESIIKVHVHTNAPGDVLTEALTYGSLLTVKIENMREQHTETVVAELADKEEAPAAAEKKYGVVAVCAGAGMEAVFRDLGADGTISGGQTMNPSTEDILRQINRTPAEVVFVLPNNKNIVMAAEQCIGLTEKKVVVIPSVSMPQGIAALMQFEPSMDEQTLTNNMKEALSAVHTLQVTYAARDSDYEGREIKEGDYLTLLEGKLLSTLRDFDDVCTAIGDKLAELTPEFVTVFYGADVSEDDAESFVSVLQSRLEDAEITLVSGGQPVYYYLISAE
ncbi:MAG: DAK2 domain-containing protein [Clostridiales bacterium]|nr:DAK2 domain-containing protein [Clostridiales bacterium]